MNRILFSILVVSFFNWGCVSNLYNEPQRMASDQIKKYPDQSHQIHEQLNEWENQRRSNPGPDGSYTLEQEKLPGFAIGGANPAVRLGNSTYQYHHKINLILVCEKNSFLPRPFSKKNVIWKLPNSLSGEVQTTFDGKIQIRVITDSDQRFQTLTLFTPQKSYEVHLTDFLIIELDKAECL